MTRPGLTDDQLLEALDATETIPSTVEITHEVWQRFDDSSSRHTVYRRLTKLEAAGVVEKEISHGGNGIGTAIWSRAGA